MRTLTLGILMALILALGLFGCEGTVPDESGLFDDGDDDLGQTGDGIDDDQEQEEEEESDEEIDDVYISEDAFGSCSGSSMEEGVCWQYLGQSYDGSNAYLKPDSVCGYVGGTYEESPCSRENLVGICTELKDTSQTFDTHFYGPTFTKESAEARCTTESAEWHPI